MSMLDRWIHNALYAKYSCTEDREYVIRKVKGEDFIIPIDYENTGVTMRNTIWSDGLHQFVQLKHNLQITTETLTSSFISNFGYIKFYQNIFGMTGTLGSIAEQNLLSSVYDVDFAKVPTFKPKEFEELDGIVVPDDDWLSLVSMEAVYMTQLGRPVLIICKTIDDLRNMEESIRSLQEIEEIANLNIRTYIDEDHSGVVKGRLNETEIVLATNIGGRGSDFKITDKVKEDGGLHVIISFLPANKRVEDQAFGRTARKGEPGTGQLIISESEIISLGIIISNETTFDTIKLERDKAEARRLEDIKNVEVKKINFQDEMFAKFASLYRGFSKKSTDLKHKYLALDLKESWAFWLHKKNYNKADLVGLQAETEFEKFVGDVKGTLGPEKHGEYTGGDITHNPYYSIRYAESLLQSDENKDAKRELEHAISLSAANPNLLYSAYLKLFEVEIELGNQIWTRFGKALAKTAIIGYFLKEEDYSKYKQRAKTNLVKANNSLSVEIKYINENFFGNDTKISNMLSNETNLLLNHTYSRLYVLSTFQNHIESLLSEIEKSGDNGIVIETRIPNYLKTLGKDDPGSDATQIRESIKDAELADFSMIGLDTIYKLETVNDPSDEVIASAQGHIAAGLISIGVGVFLPFVAPVSVPVGITLIIEGISDVIMEILDFRGKSTFNTVEYIKGKAISYGTSLATFGIGKIAQMKKVINLAIKATKNLSRILRSCPVLKKVFEKVAKLVDKLTNYLQKLVEVSKAAKGLTGLTKFQQFKSFGKSIGKGVLQDVAMTQLNERVVSKLMDEAMKDLRPKIEESVKRVLTERNLKQKLEFLGTEKVRTLTIDIIQGTYSEIAKEVLEEIGLGVLRNANINNKKLRFIVQSSGTALDATHKISKVNYYVEEFCDKFAERSSLLPRASNITLVNVNASLDFITAQLTDKMYLICTGLAGRNINKYVVSPTFNKIVKTAGKVFSKKSAKFSEIEDAVKTLGVKPGATEEEVDQRVKQLLQKGGADDSEAEILRKQLISEASEQLKISAIEEILLVSLEVKNNVHEVDQIQDEKTSKSHRGHMKTLSKSQKLAFQITTVDENGQVVGKPAILGRKYAGDSNENIVPLVFHAATKNRKGHYELPSELNIKVQYSDKNDCFYESVAAYQSSRGKSTDPEHLRNIGESRKLRNFFEDSAHVLSKIFKNKLTKKIYLKISNGLLIGGAKREQPELVPGKTTFGTPLLDAEVKRHMSSLKNRLVDAYDEAVDFERKTPTEQIEFVNLNGYIPVYRVNVRFSRRKNDVAEIIEDARRAKMDRDEKRPGNPDKFMLGIFKVKSSEGNELKIITTSGESPIVTRYKVELDNKNQDRVLSTKSQEFQYLSDQSQGYKYVHANFMGRNREIHEHVFNVYTGERSGCKYSKHCAYQKALYYVADSLKGIRENRNPSLVVDDFSGNEFFFDTVAESKESKRQRQNNNNDLKIENVTSCPGNCQPILQTLEKEREAKAKAKAKQDEEDGWSNPRQRRPGN